MLPKKRRISRKEIDKVLKSGQRLNSPHLLLYLSKTGLNYSKFSFSVSKKVCQKAVDRNKYRRRGYSIISKAGKTQAGFAGLFVFKKGSSGLSFDTIEKEVLGLLCDSGVLR
jgi:ribonuclease P protein component